MGITNVNEQGSAYGAVFRNKPVYFMTGKETEAFFDGKMRRNMELREDTCTISSNNTYRRQHTTYEVSDKDKGRIGGLPDKAANLINKTKDNARIERMKDALVDIIGKIRISGDLGIPDFTSQFQFKDGAFSVADSGFAVDMGALDGRFTPKSSGNMYKYQFKKVL